ncbi:MAG: DUF2283 domain-containing protein [Thermodesulforhabdaceae bacterium]
MDKNKIKVWYDDEMDILYVSLKEGPALDSEEIAEDLRVEYGKEREILGVEIHNITKMVAKSLASQLKEAIKEV